MPNAVVVKKTLYWKEGRYLCVCVCVCERERESIGILWGHYQLFDTIIYDIRHPEVVLCSLFSQESKLHGH